MIGIVCFIVPTDAYGKKLVTSTHAASCNATGKADTLIVVARVTEIPGAFPSNNLYNYIYIMKYHIVRIVKGSYSGKDILVGHYNPLIQRDNIKDAMGTYVSGTVKKFLKGDTHKLVLIPINPQWKQSVVDEYFDSDLPKYYALNADIASK
jgi:protoporphyrinogen oxidase